MIRPTAVAFSLLAVFGLHLPLEAQSFPGAEAFELRNAFGGSVTIAGPDVLVGEPNNRIRPGTVYVYRKAGGNWTEVAQITASDGAPNDRFGAAMAADGDVLLVSSINGVYAFQRAGQGWSEAGRLSAADVGEGDGFGAAIALSGSLALIGAPGAQEGAGAVYVFRRSGTTWSQTSRVDAPEGVGGANFGVSVALDGGRALVGSLAAGQGAVHAFAVEANGSLTGATAVAAAGGGRRGGGGGGGAGGGRGGRGAGPAFGVALDLDGDRAVIGATGGVPAVGVAHVFEVDDEGEWREVSRLLPFAASPGGGRGGVGFGASVAIEGDRVWVGAPGAGAAYQFEGASAGGFSRAEVIAPPDGIGGAFSSTMAVSDGVIAFGIPSADAGIGQASIFEGSGTGWREANRVMSVAEEYTPVRGGQVDCSGEEGMASDFRCEEVDLVAYMPVSELGADRGVGTNDVWGWTDPETGREYALVGMRNQASFVDLSDPANPVLVGRLPMTETARPSTWRDIKTYENHAFIVSDGAGQHGMQVFDLTRLREFDGEPITFDEDALYTQIASAHNIVINEEIGYAYSVGSSSGGETCGGGLHIIDIREPKSPAFAGCFADELTGRGSTGYTHDAQCVIYRGPDEEHEGKHICMGANETALSIADVSDPANPIALSRASYPNVGYAHQGWLTEDHRYFYLDDELDELNTPMPGTRTLIWDVTDLEDPILVKEHFGTTTASDHNLYVVGDRMYQSNYQSGLRILDISDPENPREVAFFDTVPHGTNTPSMGGSWSNYPFFKSGVIIVTSGGEGLFIVKSRDGRPIS